MQKVFCNCAVSLTAKDFQTFQSYLTAGSTTKGPINAPSKKQNRKKNTHKKKTLNLPAVTLTFVLNHRSVPGLAFGLNREKMWRR